MQTQAHFENIQPQIIKELQTAKESIYVAVAWFTDPELFQLLCTKSGQGVKVNLLLLNDEINNHENYGLDFGKLGETGGQVNLIGSTAEMMHNKFCVIDRSIVITGSYNWTRRARNNDENITITKNSDGLALDFITEFQRLKKKYLPDEARSEVDLNTVLKRLEIVKNTIALQDKEDIDYQTGKIKKLFPADTDHEIHTEIKQVIQHIDQQAYGLAVNLISTILTKFQTLVSWTDPEIAGLQLEIRALSLQLNSLEDELCDIEKIIFDFKILHSKDLENVNRRFANKSPLTILEATLNNENIRNKYQELKYQEGSYQEKKRHPTQLTQKQTLELKDTFRKISKLAHPDVVSTEFNSRASNLFIKAKEARDLNDHKTLQEILEHLENGAFLTFKFNTLTKNEELITEGKNLRYLIQQLLIRINSIKNTDAYQTIIEITDWSKFLKHSSIFKLSNFISALAGITHQIDTIKYLLTTKDLFLIPFRKGKKWGFCDREKKNLISCKYDQVELFTDSGIAVVKIDGFYGVIDRSGSVIIEFTHTLIEHFRCKASENFLIARQTEKNKFGLFDTKGQLIVPFIAQNYSDLEVLTDRFISVGKETIISPGYTSKNFYFDGDTWSGDLYVSAETIRLYSLYNSEGKLILDFIYNSISILPNALIMVSLWPQRDSSFTTYGLFDSNGKELLACIYEDIYVCPNGLVIFSNGKIRTFSILQNGELIPSIYDDLSISLLSFSDFVLEGLKEPIQVRINNKIGFINATGKELIPCIFSKVEELDNLLLVTKEKGKTGLMDQNGLILLTPEYDKIQKYTEGIFKIQKDKIWYCLNLRSGNIIMDIYDQVELLDKNYWKIKKLGKFGILNSDGNLLIQVEWDIISLIAGRFFKVKQNSLFGILSLSSTQILPCSFKDISIIGDNYFLIKDDCEFGVANERGNILLNPTYTNIKFFAPYIFVVSKGNQNSLSKGSALFHIDFGFITDFIYQSTEQITEKILRIEHTNKFGLVNQNGDIMYDCQANKITSNLGYVVAEKNEKEIWLDENMNILYDGSFDFIRNTENEFKIVSLPGEYLQPFPNGRFLKTIISKYGFLNIKNNTTIPCIYEEVKEFKDGFSSVKRNGKWGLIDKVGVEIIECKYDSQVILISGRNLVCVNEHGLWGVYDLLSKNLLFPRIYNYCSERNYDLMFLEHKNPEESGYYGFNSISYFED